MKPLIYFSYGMTKTGSTLAYHMASVTLEWAGYKPKRPPAELLGPNSKINFVQHISDDQAEALCDFAKTNGPIVLKTHTRPDPAVVRMLQDGRAMAHACYRDPRDMALSMLDHGVRARASGKPAFTEIVTLDDAKIGIRNQCDSLTAWLRLPKVMPLNYEEIAFDMERAVSKTQAQLGIEGEPDDIVSDVLDGRFTQFNKGKSQRYVTEMSAQDSEAFQTEFAPFYEFIHKNPNAPMTGQVALPPPNQLRLT